ncbi:hypothetical protein GLN3_11310 [Geobacillus lituanicus]|nr:hypothetical protein GLN3_11310 [Geobacillus lituanicus]
MEKQMKAWIQTIRQLFSPEELTRLARKTGFIRRQRSLTAEAFLTLCAWGDGSLAKQSLQRLCAALTLWHGCSLSSEGLNQRFTHISHPPNENREDFFVPMSNESLTHKESEGVFLS